MRILLVVYDSGHHISRFPTGLAYIAAVLRKEGYEVDIYSQDLHHYPDEALTGYLNTNKYDVVGVSVIGGYYQYQKLLGLSKAINNSDNRPRHYILGGHGPAPNPEYFLRRTGADVVVMGEGEVTILNLLDAITNARPFKNIYGIAYREDEKVTVNPDQPLIQDLDSIPWPAYDMFPMEHYRIMPRPNSEYTDFEIPVLSARGCIFTCNFCYRMDKGFRPRSSEGIIEEIKYLNKEFRINYIFFSDELLMSSKQRTIELCSAIIKSKLNIKWACNGRLNFATPEVLKVMKEAGCVFINYGIESLDDQVLKNMNKALTVKQVEAGVQKTLDFGMSPGLNIIFGNIGETLEILNRGVEFLLKYDDGAQLRTIHPVVPYPGSPLFDYAIEKGLLKDVEDFYENKHTNSDLLTVNLTDLSDDEVYEALKEANIRLLENYYDKKKEEMTRQTVKLYDERDVTFRGFRH